MLLDTARRLTQNGLADAIKKAVIMTVIFRKRQEVRNGWHACAPLLSLTAFGETPEQADENLQAGVAALFGPLHRAGILDAELQRMGLGPVGDDLSVTWRA